MSAKLPSFALSFAARTRHALHPATNSCTPRELTNARSALVGVAETGQGLQGGRRESSLLTFAALFVSEKRDKHKVSFCTFLHRKVRVSFITFRHRKVRQNIFFKLLFRQKKFKIPYSFTLPMKIFASGALKNYLS